MLDLIKKYEKMIDSCKNTEEIIEKVGIKWIRFI